MPHDNHVLDGVNKDAQKFPRWKYLEMAQDWVDPFGLPTVWTSVDGKQHVVRDDLIGVGSKGRFASLLVSQLKNDHIVYVAPRQGFAGISLAKLGQIYGKKVTLFCPAAKDVSIHQRVAAALGAELKFARIAAMPNLNKIAREWAEANGASFFPFGLDHPLVIAAIVKTCETIINAHKIIPREVWSVVSTGVLTRGLQIGFPGADFFGIAVARNLKAGEAGKAKIISHPLPFHRAVKDADLPPFPTVATYDAKGWSYFNSMAQGPALFWNVAAEPILTQEAKDAAFESNVPWGKFVS